MLNMDLKDYRALVDGKVDQNDKECFKIAQNIFSSIDYFNTKQEEGKQNNLTLLNTESLYKKMRQREFDDVKRQVNEMEESVIVSKSLADWKQYGKHSKTAMILNEE
jgi:hypothetical protein